MNMKTIVSAAIAASLGVASLAQADTGRHDRGADHDRQGWQQQRDQRWDGQRQGWRGEQERYHGEQRQWRQPSPQYQQRSYATPQHGYDARMYGGRPAYGYNDSYGNYRHDGGARYVRGGYLPRQYMAQRYWVNDWHARRLAPPPYGYQWVQSDAGDMILVALATGLIANVLFNQ